MSYSDRRGSAEGHLPSAFCHSDDVKMKKSARCQRSIADRPPNNQTSNETARAVIIIDPLLLLNLRFLFTNFKRLSQSHVEARLLEDRR